jgi:hypothetical protein
MGNFCNNREHKKHNQLNLLFFTLFLVWYIIITFVFLLLTSFDKLYLGVLLILSGRQGAGGFSITCNAIKEDEIAKMEPSGLRTYREW